MGSDYYIHTDLEVTYRNGKTETFSCNVDGRDFYCPCIKNSSHSKKCNCFDLNKYNFTRRIMKNGLWTISSIQTINKYQLSIQRCWRRNYTNHTFKDIIHIDQVVYAKTQIDQK